jgi:hypothetical protein
MDSCRIITSAFPIKTIQGNHGTAKALDRIGPGREAGRNDYICAGKKWRFKYLFVHSEAEGAMESPDIESGEYLRAFDELGHVFSIGTLGTEGDRFVIYPMPGILKSTKIYRSKWFIGAI